MQWEIYTKDPNWVPPLLIERKEFLDEAKNPFFEFGKVELFLAEKDGQVVGRIAAIEDPRYNEFHDVKLGGFGLFECVDDAAVSQALFDAAEAWCAERGLHTMWGPVSFSTNQECGLLVENFDDPPAILMTYNPPYYATLIEQAGYSKAKDLWAWDMPPDTPVPEKVKRVAEKIRKREDLKVRSVDMKRLDEEIERMEVIYNESWEKNWGFVPMTPAEFKKMGEDLKQIVVADLVLMAEVRGEPVAFSLTLPDFNEALGKINGRLLPTGLIKLLWHARKIQRTRLVALGIRAKWRKKGIDSILCMDTITTAHKLGYTKGEVSWTLEDNDLVNRAIEVMGGKRYKTYRMFEKSLPA